MITVPPAFGADTVWSMTPWLFSVMAVGLGLIALAAGFVLYARSRDIVPLVLILGGGLAAFVAEPLLGHLDLLVWGTGYPGGAFRAFGAAIPFIVPLVYAFYLGVSGYLGWRLLDRGLSIRGVWIFWLALVAIDFALQLVAVNLRAYMYYGDQPLRLAGLPLMTSVKNGTAYLLIGLLVWALAPRLRSASRVLLVLAPITAYMGGALITAWPWYVAVNSGMSGFVAGGVAALTFVLCALVVQAVALAAGTDSPWRQPAHA